MIALAIMVAVTALLGSVAMGMMFDANNVPDDLMLNGAYYAFQKLGNYYGIGNSLLILYALANFATQVSALVFSIDAPLKVLLSDTDARYVPIALTKTNKNGAPINGYIMTSILVGILIIVPNFRNWKLQCFIYLVIKIKCCCYANEIFMGILSLHNVKKKL